MWDTVGKEHKKASEINGLEGQVSTVTISRNLGCKTDTPIAGRENEFSLSHEVLE